jgi:cellulose synthase/poly-beta-1,6-N-acetylglucosamine synthase-like glycosyltransferase
MRKPKVSVVIPLGFGSDKLCYNLVSLFSSNFSHDLFEVIVVDQNGANETLEIANKFATRVFSSPKRGNAAARNLGASKSRGDILCFIEPDVVVPRDWLLKISNFFVEHPSTEGVGGPILPFEHKNRIQKFSGERWLVDSRFPDDIIFVKPGRMEGSLFAHNCAYRRETFVSGGGFDESFVSSDEDIDLCWRLAAEGKTLVFDPSIVLFHIFPETLPRLVTQYFRWGSGYPRLMRKAQIRKGLLGKAYHYYDLGRTFLSVLFPINARINYNLLHFVQLTSWNIGRIYGYRSYRHTA